MAKLRKLVTYTDYRWEEAELTEEQLEEKKKKLEQAQKDNKRTARIWLIITFLLMIVYAIYVSNK